MAFLYSPTRAQFFLESGRLGEMGIWIKSGATLITSFLLARELSVTLPEDLQPSQQETALPQAPGT